MPPASRRTCDYPGCALGPTDANNIRGPYITSIDNTKREEVTADLDKHIEMAHILPIRLKEKTANEINSRARELEAEANKILASREPNLVSQAESRQPTFNSAKKRIHPSAQD